MSQIHKHSIPANIAEHTLINPQMYRELYQRSVKDPDGFWAEYGKIIDWMKPYSKVKTHHSILVMSVSVGSKTVL